MLATRFPAPAGSLFYLDDPQFCLLDDPAKKNQKITLLMCQKKMIRLFDFKVDSISIEQKALERVPSVALIPITQCMSLCTGITAIHI